jgi:MFS family permease
MSSPTADRMRPEERRAGASLAAIFGLRMLGLFLILPVFAVWAKTIPGGADLTLVGLALGAYGLTQALLQIPFGMASDRLGRKKVIVFGLLLFAAGSAVAGLAGDIYTTILGRCLQGAGAISAAVTALAADLTREQHRTKVMAMIGSSIGLVFAGSLVLAPLLYAWIGMSGIFLLTGALALGAIALVTFAVPDPPEIVVPEGGRARFRQVLGDPQLMRLNFGIFALHLAQMAMFVVVPGALAAAGNLPVPEHWKVYLPVVLASFVLMVPAIIAAEKRGRMMKVFVGAVALLLASQIGFLLGRGSFAALVAMLLAFFVAFNILEASLPSLISRIAPPKSKGTALGIYNTTQSLGLFLGGSIGGALAQHVGPGAVFAFGAAVIGLWLALAATMRPPPVVALREFAIPAHLDIETIKRQLAELPGVREAVVEAEKRTAYLKVNLDRWDERLAQRILGGEI